MFRVVAAALMAVFLCLPAAANPVACADMDTAVAALSVNEAPLHEFTAEEMPAVIDALEANVIGKFNGATRAFIFATSAGVMVGIEVDGCTLDPILIGKPKPERLSGKSPDGKIGA